MALYKVVDLVI